MFIRYPKQRFTLAGSQPQHAGAISTGECHSTQLLRDNITGQVVIPRYAQVSTISLSRQQSQQSHSQDTAIRQLSAAQQGPTSLHPPIICIPITLSLPCLLLHLSLSLRCLLLRNLLLPLPSGTCSASRASGWSVASSAPTQMTSSAPSTLRSCQSTWEAAQAAAAGQDLAQAQEQQQVLLAEVLVAPHAEP
jgi:hypothetical protein